MTWLTILIALVPVPAFYLIYYRYFTFRPEYVKHLESFLAGIAFAIVMLLLGPFVSPYLSIHHPLLEGFINAALVEKLGAIVIIMAIQFYYPNYSVMESILSAMLFGIGFSLVENLSYALSFGNTIVLPRILFSVPLHMTTCGILGYYLGYRRLGVTGLFKWRALALALTVPVALHGLFDTVLIMGGYISYLASPILISIVLWLEFLMARAQTVLPRDILAAMGLSLEDWLLIERQQSYDRWIMRSVAGKTISAEPFFQWRSGSLRVLMIFTLMIGALGGLTFRTEIVEILQISLRSEDQIILLGIFPFSIGMIVMMVGAINPLFFTNSRVKIPVLTDAIVTGTDGIEETIITYDVTGANCFLKTAEQIGAGTTMDVRFELRQSVSPVLSGTIVWENHTNSHAPLGSIIRFGKTSPQFAMGFQVRHAIFRLWKGVIYNLRLPGFESARRLFMHPVSMMQDVRIMKAGTIIYREGDRGSEFFLLKKGSVIFFKKRDSGEIITFNTITDEQLFGELAIIDNHVRDMTAQCVTDCVIAVASRDNLQSLILKNTDFAMTLLETLAQRIHLSDKVLFENINTLERDRILTDLRAHATLLAVLAGTGVGTTERGFQLTIDSDIVARVLGSDASSITRELLARYIPDSDHESFPDETRMMQVDRIVENLCRQHGIRVRIK